MTIITSILSHPKEMPQTNVVAEYYRQFGPVSIAQCDFTKAKEEVCRNTAYGKYKEYDYILCVDSDEIITYNDMVKLYLDMENVGHEAYCATFWYYLNPTTIKFPPHPYKPVIAIKPSVKFVDKRLFTASETYVAPLNVHHLYFIHDQQWRDGEYKKRGIFESEKLYASGTKIIDPPQEVKDILKKLEGVVC